MIRRDLLLWISSLGLLATVNFFAIDKRSFPYPGTKVENVIEIIHGVQIADPYRWLEEADNPQVREWVEKQNNFTRSILDKLPGREKIHGRLEKLLDIGVLGTPVPRKGFYFYTKREGKQNQPILYARQGLHGEDRVLLDPNLLSKDGTIALDWWYPSRDGKLVAYGLSQSGNEQSTLHVREVASGKDLPDVIDRTRACSVAWKPDATGFYYTRYP